MKFGDHFTVPLEETVAMDSPIVETQLETLDFDTQVLDEPDYVGEVRDQTVDDVVEDSINDIVLDSDEEGNEVVNMTTGLSSEENKRMNAQYDSVIEGRNQKFKGYYYKRGQDRKVWAPSLQLPPPGQRILTDEHCNAEQSGSFYHAGDIYQESLLVSGSGISGVDEKVSHKTDINYVDKDPKRWHVLKEENSAPTNYEVMDKARDVAFAACHHGFPSMMDADSQEPEEISEVNALSFVDQFVSVNKLTLSENVECEKAKGSQSPPISRAKGVQTLVRRAHSRAKGTKPGIFDWAEEQSTENNFANELDERGDMIPMWQHLEKDESDMPEIFDVGLDTQMAAEAMEALLYANPPNSSTRYEAPENNITNLAGTGLPKNNKSKVSSHQDMAGSNSKITGRQPENSAISREPVTAKSFCGNPVNMKKNMNGRCSRVFSQPKKDKTPERHNLQKDSNSVECKNHGEDPRKPSRATKRMKNFPSMRFLEGPKDPVSVYKRKRSCKVKLNVPATKRKKNNINVEVDKKLGGIGNCFESSSDTTAEVKNLKRIQQKFASDLKGTTSLPDLVWNHPKGKRTHGNLARHSSDGSKPSAWFPLSSEENKYSLSVGYSVNIKLDAVSDNDKASETSKSDEDHKKSGNPILSKPSLTKELTRLGCNKFLPDFLPRGARRQKETVCVLFSQHLGSYIINQQKIIISRLGFSVAACCSDATHFITDRFFRTRNMLEAIALGKPVVTPLWLESCGRAAYHIDEKNYILRDAKREKEIGFSMPVSLACAKQHPLLKGRRVLITPNIKPGKELIQSLVKAVQGKEIQKIPTAAKKDKIISNDVLILSSEDDYTACLPFLKKGAPVYDSELLLNGIVIQKLEYERHRLFDNHDENMHSKAGQKKT